MSTMQLYVWSPALNAPSIDPKCIIVQAYLRLLEVDFTVVHANDPQYSPTGELPLLKDGSTWIAGVNRIISHLAKRGLDGNRDLSPEQKAEYIAYSAMAQEKLYDCLMFTWYADMTNFIKNIRPTYARILPFPSRYLVPIQLKKSAKARLAKYNVEIKDDDKGLPQNEVEEMKELQRSGWHYMYRLVREAYGVLDTFLGDKEFMFGDRSTTLDCIVFGQLALHLYPDLAHRRLQHILTTEYPRLARYCDRIKDMYFVSEQPQSGASEDVPSMWRTLWNNPRSFLTTIKDDAMSYMGNQEEEKKKKSQAQLDFERKRIWSIVGGVTFLLAYVIYNGIVSVEFGDEEEYDDYVYNDGYEEVVEDDLEEDL
ncbi:outer mitochondrial membrane transport complex protein-domain-containing protein [Zychaea mexicana]|uniref:outer mitochondrial membrane transport complex protein-domain-containing protein n=1 Tax=Zychaea mexicana TaxID=64656 RepID=UPI0022FE2F8F|nr:outer mitochondrial membrane transport complex protein-domain-containing protein [Zychaea mexicana]KAI9489236.1 outer mitochondrial membrane transport complex protein-domain-containing protein [Zychaea mexicana]